VVKPPDDGTLRAFVSAGVIRVHPPTKIGLERRAADPHHAGVAIILASASPRRLQLLTACGWEVEVRPAHVDEAALPGEPAAAMVERLARHKARAVSSDAEHIVVAADTTVVLDGEALAKPLDDADAQRMLGRLQGRTHEVLTGYCVRRGAREQVGVVRTEVAFRPLTDREIAAYVATGEPRDKAGAYGIQGQGGALVDRVVGSYPNVVGLPVAEVVAAIRALERAP
jgi:septum formation protein